MGDLQKEKIRECGEVRQGVELSMRYLVALLLQQVAGSHLLFFLRRRMNNWVAVIYQDSTAAELDTLIQL